jgi:HTH-type transcriptional repressor of NAD biosynthesis genes
MKIALLGAESTGKTTLATELAARLRQQGKSVAVVPEVLREWVARAGREPRPEQQLPSGGSTKRPRPATSSSPTPLP